jgi:hypothetical protein
MRLARYLVGFLLVLSSACDPREKFLVPGSFDGPVAIVFGDHTGQRVSDFTYDIPRNGRLFIDGEPPRNSTILFYMVDSSGQRRQLEPTTSAAKGYFGFATESTSLCNVNDMATSIAFFVGTPLDHLDWQVVRDRHMQNTLSESLRRQGRLKDAECVAREGPIDERAVPPEYREKP